MFAPLYENCASARVRAHKSVAIRNHVADPKPIAKCAVNAGHQPGDKIKVNHEQRVFTVEIPAGVYAVSQ